MDCDNAKPFGCTFLCRSATPVYSTSLADSIISFNRSELIKSNGKETKIEQVTNFLIKNSLTFTYNH